MANQTVYPYGQNGTLPSGYPIADDLVTDSAQQALSARQGKVLYERIFKPDAIFWKNSSSVQWNTGNVANGSIVSTYANKYVVISNFPNGVTELKVTRVVTDSNYSLNVYGSTDGTSWTQLAGFSTSGGTKTYTLGSYTRLMFLLWDKPTTERAQQENITVAYSVESDVLNTIDVVDNLSSQRTDLPLSAKQGSVLDGKIMSLKGGFQQYPLTWSTGNINVDGQITTYANQITGIILLEQQEVIFDNPTAYTVKICLYDNSGYIGVYSNNVPSGQRRTYTFNAQVVAFRLVAYDKPSASDVLPIFAGYVPNDTLLSLRQSINSLSGSNSYSNPVLNVDIPDPCVINGEDGYFYLLGTGQLASRTMFRSPNLVDWEETDRPFTDKAVTDCYADLGVSYVNFWAPEIVKIGDKYNMYTSKGETPLLVFQSKHPNFGYEYIGQIITTSTGLNTENIDACVRYDLDGSLWIFWDSRTTGIYRQKLSADGLSLDTNDTKVHVAGKSISQDSTRMTVFEGAYLYRRKGYWYLFVSAGRYNNDTYCIKVGRSATLTGTFVDKEGNNMTDGYGTTILSSASNDILYGPGHNGQIITDRNNHTYMVYHSHYTEATSTSARYICLQEIFWDVDGWPYFANNKPQVSGNTRPVL